jgi:hypothetical protein
MIAAVYARKRTPLNRAAGLVSTAWILWVGAGVEGRSVVSWANAVRAFETKAACDAAAKDMATKPDSIPKSLQDPRVTWVFECFPSETAPNAVPR